MSFTVFSSPLLQQVIFLNSGSSSVSVNANTDPFQCRQIWDPVHARFGVCFLPFIAALPSLVAACIVLACLLSPLRRWLPQWALPFAMELSAPEGEIPDGSTKRPMQHAIALLVASLIGLLLHVVVACVPEFSVVEIIPAFSWVLAGILLAITRPKKTPFSLLILYASILASRLILLSENRSMPVTADIPVMLESLTAFVSVIIILRMPMQRPDFLSKDVSKPFTEPTNQLRSPEENLTLWQWMTVSWMVPLIRVGSKRQLHDEDVWSLSYEFQHRRLHDAFRVLKGSVVRRLLAANGLDLITICTLGVIELLASML